MFHIDKTLELGVSGCLKIYDGSGCLRNIHDRTSRTGRRKKQEEDERWEKWKPQSRRITMDHLLGSPSFDQGYNGYYWLFIGTSLEVGYLRRSV